MTVFPCKSKVDCKIRCASVELQTWSHAKPAIYFLLHPASPKTFKLHFDLEHARSPQSHIKTTIGMLSLFLTAEMEG